MNKEPKPALLTKSEIAFLMGKTNPNPNLAKVMRHNILSKVKTFINLELPLIKDKAESWPNLLSALSPLVNISINQVNTGINHRKEGSEPLIINEIVGSVGFEPTTYRFPRSRSTSSNCQRTCRHLWSLPSYLTRSTFPRVS